MRMLRIVIWSGVVALVLIVAVLKFADPIESNRPLAEQAAASASHTNPYFHVHVGTYGQFTGGCLVRQADGRSASHDISGSDEVNAFFIGDWIACSAQKSIRGEHTIDLRITDESTSNDGNGFRVVGESEAIRDFGIAEVSGS